jgi:uncharacterized protein (TIGR02466 family)
MNVKVTTAFAVPFGSVEYDAPDRDKLCQELADLFESESAHHADKVRNEIRRDTQKGSVFESKFDLFDWPHKPVRQLRDFVDTSLRRYLGEVTTLGDEGIGRLVLQYHAWFHLTGHGGRQGIHNHSNASWSGIFCVDPGDSVADFPDSGVVYFHDPRSNANIYEDSGNRYLKAPFSHGAVRVEHQKGRLFLFPSYLLHEIFPYFGKRHRIVVAFNCRVLLPDDYARNTL